MFWQRLLSGNLQVISARQPFASKAPPRLESNTITMGASCCKCMLARRLPRVPCRRASRLTCILQISAHLPLERLAAAFLAALLYLGTTASDPAPYIEAASRAMGTHPEMADAHRVQATLRWQTCGQAAWRVLAWMSQVGASVASISPWCLIRYGICRVDRVSWPFYASPQPQTVSSRSVSVYGFVTASSCFAWRPFTSRLTGESWCFGAQRGLLQGNAWKLASHHASQLLKLAPVAPPWSRSDHALDCDLVAVQAWLATTPDLGRRDCCCWHSCYAHQPILDHVRCELCADAVVQLCFGAATVTVLSPLQGFRLHGS